MIFDCLPTLKTWFWQPPTYAYMCAYKYIYIYIYTYSFNLHVSLVFSKLPNWSSFGSLLASAILRIPTIEDPQPWQVHWPHWPHCILPSSAFAGSELLVFSPDFSRNSEQFFCETKKESWEFREFLFGLFSLGNTGVMLQSCRDLAGKETKKTNFHMFTTRELNWQNQGIPSRIPLLERSSAVQPYLSVRPVCKKRQPFPNGKL